MLICLFPLSVGDAEIQGQKVVPVLGVQRSCLWLCYEHSSGKHHSFPDLPVTGQRQFFLLEDVFLLLLLESSQWESRRNFTGGEKEAGIAGVLLRQLAHAVADFFFQKELNHHCGM